MSWFKDRQKAEDEFLLRNNDEVRSRSKWWSRVLQDLNLMLNPYHDWYEYGTDDFESTFDNLTNKYLEKGLTDREREANAFTAEEAQKSRDFTEYMARNKYAIETQSMQDAGINPAMVYGGGSLVPTASNGAHGTSVAPTGGLTDIIPQIMSLVRMPLEMKAMQAEINKTNMDIEKSKADIDKTNAETKGLNLQNEITEGTKDSIIKVTNMEPEEKRATIDNIVAKTNNENLTNQILGVQLLQSKLDYEQNKRMNELIFEMQRMQNDYQKFVNNHQERQWNAEYNRICAEVNELYTRGLKNMSDIEVNNAQKAVMYAQEGLYKAETATENVRTKHEAVNTWKDYNDPKAHLVRSVVDPMDKVHTVLKIGRNFREDFKRSGWQPKGRVTKASDNANRAIAESLQEMYKTMGQAYEEFGDIQ